MQRWDAKSMLERGIFTDAQIEIAAGVLFCHAQFNGDPYTARSLVKKMLEAAIKIEQKRTT